MERAGLICEIRKLGAISTKTQIMRVATFRTSNSGMLSSIGACCVNIITGRVEGNETGMLLEQN